MRGETMLRSDSVASPGGRSILRNSLAAVIDALTLGSVRRAIKGRTRIHHVYYLLAAFDVLAVAGGLHLSHRLTSLYVESVSVNQVWAGHIRSFSKLGDVAQSVNAPGNDVFDSRDEAKERERRDTALNSFNADLSVIEKDLAKSDNPSLTGAAAAIRLHMAEMVGEADTIFSMFAAGRGADAGERMATMDRKYALLTRAINDTTGLIQDIQATEFATQLEQSSMLRKLEYLIGGLILLMVCCVAVFGHRISNTLKQADEAQRAAAEQLTAVNEDVTNLNVELARRIIELKEAQDEIIKKGKLAQLGQLTATVAHEIRNPLGVVKTSVQLVEHKVQNKNLGLEKPLERINKAISRCDSIITELLGFTRSKALNLKPTRVDDWVAGVVDEEMRALPASIGVSVTRQLDGMEAEFDQEQLRRVLINLLSNAAEAMVGKGSVKVKQVTLEPRIEVSTLLVDGNVEIRVKDNGPGISDENKRKILEPLFTTKSFGVGLGLPTVAAVLEQHGGGLRIDSRLGEGAQFTAWFPRRMSDAAPTKSAA